MRRPAVVLLPALVLSGSVSAITVYIAYTLVASVVG